MSINEALEREAFEQWAESVSGHRFGPDDRRPDGQYYHKATENTWLGWSARSQAPAPAWVAVSERLPEPTGTPDSFGCLRVHVPVLAKGCRGWMHGTFVFAPVQGWHRWTVAHISGDMTDDITHWCELPALPDEFPPPPQAEEKV